MKVLSVSKPALPDVKLPINDWYKHIKNTQDKLFFNRIGKYRHRAELKNNDRK